MKQLYDIPCPRCQRPVRAPAADSATAVTCPHCGHSFRPKVRIECPLCRFALHVPVGYLGKPITCSQCNHTYQATSKDVPAPAVAPAVPVDPPSAPAAPPAEPDALAVERLSGELAALRRELEAARAGAAEELARLTAAHKDRQEQLDVVRLRHEEERAGLQAEAEQLRQQHDEALRRGDALAAERDALAAARQQLSVQVEDARAELERLPQPVPQAAQEAAEVADARQQAAAQQQRGERTRGPEGLAAHRRYEEQAPRGTTQQPPREQSRPAEVDTGGTEQRRDGRSPRWVFPLLALFLWVASLPAGLPATPRDAAFTLLFALTLLLQFRLWDELEDVGERAGLRKIPTPAVSPLGFLLAAATAWNTAYLIFSGSWLRLGAFAALSVALLLWYKHRRQGAAGASSLVALVKYPALVYLLAAPTLAAPGVPLLLALALVYLCFAAFELLHEGRLRAPAGAEGLLALSVGLMVGVSVLMATTRADRDSLVAVVRWGLVAPGAAVLLWLYWRRSKGRAPGVWDYIVFVVGFAWLLSFSLGGR